MNVHLSCPSCRSKQLTSFYQVKNVPIHSSLLLSNKFDAISFPTGNIKLGFCENCGFIFNIVFDPSLLSYSKYYEDQQCFSPTYNAFTKEIARHLIEEYSLQNKDILEIGCGKGDFLSLICELGDNYCVGIDPAVIPERVQSSSPNRLKFIVDYYSEKYAEYVGDIVVCRHTLEHIHDTFNFICNIRKSICNRDTVVYFEVPDVTRILNEYAFWDIYYEHCSYFSIGSIARLFRSCFFNINNIYRGFGDQYIMLEAKTIINKSTKKLLSEENIVTLSKSVNLYTKHSQKKINEWSKFFKENSEMRIAIWGSGSKCVAFMTTIGIKNEIGCIVDINPYRHGKFLPSIAKEIRAPLFLKKFKPDITLIMNPIYVDEISESITAMEIDTKIMTVD